MKYLFVLFIVFLHLCSNAQTTYAYNLTSVMDSVQVQLTIFEDNNSLVYLNNTELIMLHIAVDDSWESEGYLIIRGESLAFKHRYRITVSDIGMEIYNEHTKEKFNYYK